MFYSSASNTFFHIYKFIMKKNESYAHIFFKKVLDNGNTEQLPKERVLSTGFFRSKDLPRYILKVKKV